jgi:hypothetical protein
VKKVKMKQVATGEILMLWKSTDHPEAKPDKPVWTDETGSYWGTASGAWGEKPSGFIRMDSREAELFSFNLHDYIEFKRFLMKLDPANPISWPSEERKLSFPGMPAYRLKNYLALEGNESWRLIITFIDPVVLPNTSIGARFIIGGRPAMEFRIASEDPIWVNHF